MKNCENIGEERLGRTCFMVYGYSVGRSSLLLVSTHISRLLFRIRRLVYLRAA